MNPSTEDQHAIYVHQIYNKPENKAHIRKYMQSIKKSSTFTVIREHRTNYTQADGMAKAEVSHQNDGAFSYRSRMV